MKNSKIIKKVGNGTWNTKQGETMYAWELEMENGDVGVANTKDADGKNLPEGDTIDYNYTESERGNKIQKVYVPGSNPKGGSNGSKGSNGSFALSYAKDLVVAAIRADVSNASVDADEDVIKIADKFKKWLDEN